MVVPVMAAKVTYPIEPQFFLYQYWLLTKSTSIPTILGNNTIFPQTLVAIILNLISGAILNLMTHNHIQS